MARNSISFNGIGDLQSKLKRNASMGEVKKIVKKNTVEMNSSAQRKAPVDTGFLRRMIIMSLVNNGLTGRSTAGAEYSPYPEYGTRFMAAQPFMGPAYREQKEKFKRDMQRLVK
ncbi:HK97-gp10 family putative phage morphogenesis protein [Enterococcus devriesei]|uniref:HK97-gp10 family putative phage morphogenesis protein n=1 Tax=Enterococcus devriesei TaxID=319970 RepID=UPI0028AA822C|nr:HK97-gp10 family putative phage morphogenesis protein [Enterococcus devriesei]